MSFAVIAAIIPFTATFAVADISDQRAEHGFSKYGSAGDWTVYINVTGSSCLIERVDSQSTIVQMGLTDDSKLGYVGVFSRTADLSSNSKNDAFVDLGGNMYRSSVTRDQASIAGGYTGRYVMANNPQFFEDLAGKSTMTMFPDEEQEFIVNLAGSGKAIELARACNSTR